MASERVWQASEARAKLPEVMSGALSGSPQIIRGRGGEEVVVVSRADYERMKPTLKDYLLRSPGAAGVDDDDMLEAALRRVRGIGICSSLVR
jgi:prevent-host-death family protein